MRLNTRLSASLAAFALLAGCHGGRNAPSAEKAWVRLPAVPGRPAAAYLLLHGGEASARLLSIDSPQAGSSELHQSMKVNAGGGMPGMSSMRRVDMIDLPAGGTVAFAPDGYHVMLFGLSRQVKAGDEMPLTVRFARGDPLTIEAKVVSAADNAPY